MYPGTFEIYVQETAKPLLLERHTSTVPKLPLIASPSHAKDEEKRKARLKKESSLVPHPPIPAKKVMLKRDDTPKHFLHAKFHNMIFRKGTPPLTDFVYEWSASSKVDCRRLYTPPLQATPRRIDGEGSRERQPLNQEKCGDVTSRGLIPRLPPAPQSSTEKPPSRSRKDTTGGVGTTSRDERNAPRSAPGGSRAGKVALDASPPCSPPKQKDEHSPAAAGLQRHNRATKEIAAVRSVPGGEIQQSPSPELAAGQELRNARAHRNLLKHIEATMLELVAFETSKRKAIQREHEVQALKFIRELEEMLETRQKPPTNSKGRQQQHRKSTSRSPKSEKNNTDYERKSLAMIRTLSIGVLGGALSIRETIDGEAFHRDSIDQEELRKRLLLTRKRNAMAVLIHKHVTEYHGIARYESYQRDLMAREFTQETENARRCELIQCERRSFEGFLVNLHTQRHAHVLDDREVEQRMEIVNEQLHSRLLIEFHSSFRLVSLGELRERIQLKEQFIAADKDLAVREASAIRIQAAQRSVLARKEANRRRSMLTNSITEAAHRSALSSVSSKRQRQVEVLLGASLPSVPPPSLQTPIAKLIFDWAAKLERQFLTNLENRSGGSEQENYDRMKTQFAMDLASYKERCKPSAKDSSADRRANPIISERCKVLVELLLREPDSNRANLMLLNVLEDTPEVNLPSIISDGDLLLDTITDGSCTYFDALLGCRGVSLSPSQALFYISTALGSPTKRLLFAGTILRRELALQVLTINAELQPYWFDFYWHVSCFNPNYSGVEEGLDLRLPLLQILSTHHNVHIDFTQPGPNPDEPISLLGRICREGEHELLHALLTRSSTNHSLRTALTQRSGNKKWTPLGHACGSNRREAVAELLMDLDVVEAERDYPCAVHSVEQLPHIEDRSALLTMIHEAIAALPEMEKEEE